MNTLTKLLVDQLEGKLYKKASGGYRNFSTVDTRILKYLNSLAKKNSQLYNKILQDYVTTSKESKNKKFLNLTSFTSHVKEGAKITSVSYTSDITKIGGPLFLEIKASVGEENINLVIDSNFDSNSEKKESLKKIIKTNLKALDSDGKEITLFSYTDKPEKIEEPDTSQSYPEEDTGLDTSDTDEEGVDLGEETIVASSIISKLSYYLEDIHYSHLLKILNRYQLNLNKVLSEFESYISSSDDDFDNEDIIRLKDQVNKLKLYLNLLEKISGSSDDESGPILYSSEFSSNFSVVEDDSGKKTFVLKFDDMGLQKEYEGKSEYTSFDKLKESANLYIKSIKKDISTKKEDLKNLRKKYINEYFSTLYKQYVSDDEYFPIDFRTHMLISGIKHKDEEKLTLSGYEGGSVIPVTNPRSLYESENTYINDFLQTYRKVQDFTKAYSEKGSSDKVYSTLGGVELFPEETQEGPFDLGYSSIYEDGDPRNKIEYGSESVGARSIQQIAFEKLERDIDLVKTFQGSVDKRIADIVSKQMENFYRRYQYSRMDGQAGILDPTAGVSLYGVSKAYSKVKTHKLKKEWEEQKEALQAQIKLLINGLDFDEMEVDKDEWIAQFDAEMKLEIDSIQNELWSYVPEESLYNLAKDTILIDQFALPSQSARSSVTGSGINPLNIIPDYVPSENEADDNYLNLKANSLFNKKKSGISKLSRKEFFRLLKEANEDDDKAIRDRRIDQIKRDKATQGSFLSWFSFSDNKTIPIEINLDNLEIELFITGYDQTGSESRQLKKVRLNKIYSIKDKLFGFLHNSKSYIRFEKLEEILDKNTRSLQQDLSIIGSALNRFDKLKIDPTDTVSSIEIKYKIKIVTFDQRGSQKEFVKTILPDEFYITKVYTAETSPTLGTSTPITDYKGQYQGDYSNNMGKISDKLDGGRFEKALSIYYNSKHNSSRSEEYRKSKKEFNNPEVKKEVKIILEKHPNEININAETGNKTLSIRQSSKYIIDNLDRSEVQGALLELKKGDTTKAQYREIASDIEQFSEFRGNPDIASRLRKLETQRDPDARFSDQRNKVFIEDFEEVVSQNNIVVDNKTVSESRVNNRFSISLDQTGITDMESITSTGVDETKQYFTSEFYSKQESGYTRLFSETLEQDSLTSAKLNSGNNYFEWTKEGRTLPQTMANAANFSGDSLDAQRLRSDMPYILRFILSAGDVSQTGDFKSSGNLISPFEIYTYNSIEYVDVTNKQSNNNIVNLSDTFKRKIKDELKKRHSILDIEYDADYGRGDPGDVVGKATTKDSLKQVDKIYDEIDAALYYITSKYKDLGQNIVGSDAKKRVLLTKEDALVLSALDDYIAITMEQLRKARSLALSRVRHGSAYDFDRKFVSYLDFQARVFETRCADYGNLSSIYFNNMKKLYRDAKTYNSIYFDLDMKDHSIVKMKEILDERRQSITLKEENFEIYEEGNKGKEVRQLVFEKMSEKESSHAIKLILLSHSKSARINEFQKLLFESEKLLKGFELENIIDAFYNDNKAGLHGLYEEEIKTKTKQISSTINNEKLTVNISDDIIAKYIVLRELGFLLDTKTLENPNKLPSPEDAVFLPKNSTINIDYIQIFDRSNVMSLNEYGSKINTDKEYADWKSSNGAEIERYKLNIAKLTNELIMSDVYDVYYRDRRDIESIPKEELNKILSGVDNEAELKIQSFEKTLSEYEDLKRQIEQKANLFFENNSRLKQQFYSDLNLVDTDDFYSIIIKRIELFTKERPTPVNLELIKSLIRILSKNAYIGDADFSRKNIETLNRLLSALSRDLQFNYDQRLDRMVLDYKSGTLDDSFDKAKEVFSDDNMLRSFNPESDTRITMKGFDTESLVSSFEEGNLDSYKRKLKNILIKYEADDAFGYGKARLLNFLYSTNINKINELWTNHVENDILAQNKEYYEGSKISIDENGRIRLENSKGKRIAINHKSEDGAKIYLFLNKSLSKAVDDMTMEDFKLIFNIPDTQSNRLGDRASEHLFSHIVLSFLRDNNNLARQSIVIVSDSTEQPGIKVSILGQDVQLSHTKIESGLVVPDDDKNAILEEKLGERQIPERLELMRIPVDTDFRYDGSLLRLTYMTSETFNMASYQGLLSQLNSKFPRDWNGNNDVKALQEGSFPLRESKLPESEVYKISKRYSDLLKDPDIKQLRDLQISLINSGRAKDAKLLTDEIKSRINARSKNKIEAKNLEFIIKALGFFNSFEIDAKVSARANTEVLSAKLQEFKMQIGNIRRKVNRPLLNSSNSSVPTYKADGKVVPGYNHANTEKKVLSTRFLSTTMEDSNLEGTKPTVVENATKNRRLYFSQEILIKNRTNVDVFAYFVGEDVKLYNFSLGIDIKVDTIDKLFSVLDDNIEFFQKNNMISLAKQLMSIRYGFFERFEASHRALDPAKEFWSRSMQEIGLDDDYRPKITEYDVTSGVRDGGKGDVYRYANMTDTQYIEEMKKHPAVKTPEDQGKIFKLFSRIKEAIPEKILNAFASNPGRWMTTIAGEGIFFLSSLKLIWKTFTGSIRGLTNFLSSFFEPRDIKALESTLGSLLRRMGSFWKRLLSKPQYISQLTSLEQLLSDVRLSEQSLGRKSSTMQTQDLTAAQKLSEYNKKIEIDRQAIRKIEYDLSRDASKFAKMLKRLQLKTPGSVAKACSVGFKGLGKVFIAFGVIMSVAGLAMTLAKRSPQNGVDFGRACLPLIQRALHSMKWYTFSDDIHKGLLESDEIIFGQNRTIKSESCTDMESISLYNMIIRDLKMDNFDKDIYKSCLNTYIDSLNSEISRASNAKPKNSTVGQFSYGFPLTPELVMEAIFNSWHTFSYFDTNEGWFSSFGAFFKNLLKTAGNVLIWVTNGVLGFFGSVGSLLSPELWWGELGDALGTAPVDISYAKTSAGWLKQDLNSFRSEFSLMIDNLEFPKLGPATRGSILLSPNKGSSNLETEEVDIKCTRKDLLKKVKQRYKEEEKEDISDVKAKRIVNYLLNKKPKKGSPEYAKWLAYAKKYCK